MNLKTRTYINAKISVFVICVEAIMYLLLYDLHDCTLMYFTFLLLYTNSSIHEYIMFYQNLQNHLLHLQGLTWLVLLC